MVIVEGRLIGVEVGVVEVRVAIVWVGGAFGGAKVFRRWRFQGT